MQAGVQIARSSSTGTWTGRIISGVVVLFLIFDATIKIIRANAAVQGTVQMGYPQYMVVPIGVTLLMCLIAYVLPRTSVLGAILLTGYLGGATATTVRVENHWFLMPVAVGILVWAGLFFRDEQIRALIPFRKTTG